MRTIFSSSLMIVLLTSCVGNEPSKPNVQDGAITQNTNKDALAVNTGGSQSEVGSFQPDTRPGGAGGAGGGIGLMDAANIQGTGGITISGGTIAGGATKNGGSTTQNGGTGGNVLGGAGGTANGGSTPPPPTSTACSSVGPGASGSGSYTQYYFGQGTFKENGGYRTACGYFGKEPSGMSSDTVENIANPKYFAAIPSNSSTDFDSNRFCGACAEVTGNGKSVVVTVIDACPKNTNKPCKENPNGHLDLSVAAMQAIGYTGNNLYPKNTSWKFVPCPVTGNVIVRVKPGNFDQIYIENTILPIKSVSMDGVEGKHLYYGTWQLPGIVIEKTLTLTDSAGRTLTVVPKADMGMNYDTGMQFPKCNQS